MFKREKAIDERRLSLSETYKVLGSRESKVETSTPAKDFVLTPLRCAFWRRYDLLLSKGSSLGLMLLIHEAVEFRRREEEEREERRLCCD